MNYFWYFVFLGGLCANLVLLSGIAIKLFGLDRRVKRLNNKVHVVVDNSEQDLFRQFQAFSALRGMISNADRLPPLRGWAASPDFLVEVLRLIEKKRPEVVVELGSGASTLAIASFLEEKNQGQLFSFDHDLGYSKQTANMVSESGLNNRAQVVFAPLVNYQVKGESWLWYSLENFPDSVDMVIVDGPPQSTQPLARYPAIPLVSPFFSSNAVVVLDDAGRKDEQEIVERWQAEGSWSVTNPVTEKGMAVLDKNEEILGSP